MKNILYLHGLDSFPKPEKIEILRSKGSVVAPKLNYYAFKNDINLFNELANSIRMEDVTHIVGSSFGGYMGFYLSEYCRIPAVLFNPAINFASIEVPVEKTFNNIGKTIILGENDDVIDPKGTIRFIADNAYTNTRVIQENFGHMVSLDNFTLALNYI